MKKGIKIAMIALLMLVELVTVHDIQAAARGRGSRPGRSGQFAGRRGGWRRGRSGRYGRRNRWYGGTYATPYWGSYWDPYWSYYSYPYYWDYGPYGDVGFGFGFYI